MISDVLDVQDVLVIIPTSIVDDYELEMITLHNVNATSVEDANDYVSMMFMCSNQDAFTTIHEMLESYRYELSDVFSKEIIQNSLLVPVVDGEPLDEFI